MPLSFRCDMETHSLLRWTALLLVMLSSGNKPFVENQSSNCNQILGAGGRGGANSRIVVIGTAREEATTTGLGSGPIAGIAAGIPVAVVVGGL